MLTSSTDVGKSMLTRALLAVYRRNTTNVPLRNYIKAYMSVQVVVTTIESEASHAIASSMQ
jgi:hypothetical protein